MKIVCVVVFLGVIVDMGNSNPLEKKYILCII